jgi:hypothetical protein
MDNEFDAVMQKRTDAELIKILNSPPDHYQPAALEAAQTEFERRNLSETEVASAKQEIAQEQAIDEANANKPLGALPKVVAFPVPGHIISYVRGNL